MKKELDEKLCAKYPEIFKDRHGKVTETLMCWGFDVEDGWYQLIDDLCAALCLIAVREKVDPPVAVQVKEKFGGLRFYINRGSDAMHDAINHAEDRSYMVCEICSKPGRLNKYGWLRVRCEEHTK